MLIFVRLMMFLSSLPSAFEHHLYSICTDFFLSHFIDCFNSKDSYTCHQSVNNWSCNLVCQFLITQLNTAYDVLTAKRPCGPNKRAIRGATYDLAKDGPWKEPFESLPEYAFENVADWERKLIQQRVRALRSAWKHISLVRSFYLWTPFWLQNS